MMPHHHPGCESGRLPGHWGSPGWRLLAGLSFEVAPWDLCDAFCLSQLSKEESISPASCFFGPFDPNEAQNNIGRQDRRSSLFFLFGGVAVVHFHGTMGSIVVREKGQSTFYVSFIVHFRSNKPQQVLVGGSKLGREQHQLMRYQRVAGYRRG